MRLALDLADAGLLALPQEGEVSAPSPGLAIIDGETITVGREAAARARLTPRRLHSRFWLDISTEPLGRPFGRRLRSADLAWYHLTDLWREAGRGVNSVILALPGGRNEAQLGLILGVARSAGLPVDGMVDAAVAAAVGHRRDASVLVLDLELHRSVLTVIEPGLRRGEVLVSDRVGLAALHDAWLRLIAGLFLKSKRFDPFHSASSEQDLYDRLPSILAELHRRSSTSVMLAADDNVFSIDLDRDRVVVAAEPRYGEIDGLVRAALESRPGVLLLTARAASAPGLAHRLAGLTGIEVIELPLAAAAAGAHECAQQIVAPGSSLPFVTDLGETGSRSVEAAPASAEAGSRRPTHLVVDGVAHPLGAEELWLGSAPAAGNNGVVVGRADDGIRDRHCVFRLRDGGVWVEDLSGGDCTLNDRPLDNGAELEAGDRLRLGDSGVEVVLVAVGA